MGESRTAAETLTEGLRTRAWQLGFARLGIARAGALEQEGRWLDAWLAAGKHGQMDYMSSTAEVRKDPRHAGMLADAKSVVVIAAPYGGEPDARVGPEPAQVARYARGRDYHRVVRKRLDHLARYLRASGHIARTAVDTFPVLERAWAQRAGLGFIGKNCCLIVPGIGSHVFLGAIVTSASLVADAPMEQRCGTCARCLDACPTKAFDAPRQLDARRCIAYLNIELRGPIPAELRQPMGNWLFGCDACQDVCPFNQGKGAALGWDAFGPHPRWRDLKLEHVLQMSEADFQETFTGSPLRRPGLEGLARNAAIVLGNMGTKRHLPVLQRTATHHPSPVVREAAAWAQRRLA